MRKQNKRYCQKCRRKRLTDQNRCPICGSVLKTRVKSDYSDQKCLIISLNKIIIPKV